MAETKDYEFNFPFAGYMKKTNRQLHEKEPLEIFSDVPKLFVPLLASFQAHIGGVAAIGQMFLLVSPDHFLIALMLLQTSYLRRSFW